MWLLMAGLLCVVADGRSLCVWLLIAGLLCVAADGRVAVY